MKHFTKCGKAAFAGVVALALAAQPVISALPAYAEEGAAAKKTVSDLELAKHDNVLYTANVGTTDPSTTPDDATLGALQSNVDQEYGADTGTGYKWGYQPDDENSARKSGGSDNTTLKGSYIYMSDDSSVIYDAEKSGFYYDFEIPERTDNEYTVTVGVTVPNWWGNKVVDVIMEGNLVGDAVSCPQNATTENTYTVKVTDGELNICVKADPDKRSGTGDDPMLSYIIVKAANVPEISEEELLASYKADLQAKVDEYKAAVTEEDEAKYSAVTWSAYAGALADAEAVLKNNKATLDNVKAALTTLTTAYTGLTEKVVYDSFTGTNGDRMYATSGEKIQAHGGQIQKIGDTYYWIGEDRTNEYRPMPGVHLYTSKDLYNWTDEGVVLRTMDNYEQFETDEYFKSLYGDLTADEKKDIYVDLWAEGCVMERPKMLYNEKTGKYVIWFHADGTSPYAEDTGSNYAKAKAGIAIADNPAGPYKLLGSYLLCSDYENHGFDSVGGHVRDMNVFQDDDGTAYVMYSSEGNAVMYIAKLNDTYTGLAKPADEMVLGEDFCISSTDSREAPAMFKYNGKYYLITSGCTGWAPNQAAYAVADSPLGPWTRMGDPCVGDTNHNTFSTQSTCVIPVDAENGKFIYMGDRWYNPDNGAKLSDSRYVWLPIEFGSDNTILIRDYSDWTLDELEGKGAITVNTELPTVTGSVADLLKELPETLDVSIGNENYPDAAVEWSYSGDKNYALGNVTVSGIVTLTEGVTREVSLTVFCCPKQLVYFADCYTNGDNTSAIFEKFAANADDLLNTVSDQAYGDDKGVNWGYTSTPGASGGSSSEDMGSKGSGDFYDTGWWATSSGNIEYGFELEPGNYVVSTGFNEWWSSTRGIKITVSSVDGSGTATEIGTGTASLSSGKTQDQSNVTVTVPEDSDHILVTISKASGSDPVLSWIGITSTDESSPAADNLIVNGGFEDGLSTGWNADNGSHQLMSDGAAEGTYYCAENGPAGQWGGTGIGQSITVSPDTEYVLTGTAKVDSSAEYWVGAKVDSKEIYAVFSAKTDYADTTNTDKKLAYQVCPGATDWTDFEIKFTTGSATTSVDVYSWVAGGYGYIDNLVLTEVSSSLDWTSFDEVMAEIAALDKAEYTEASWTEFQAVVDEAKAFKENASDTTKQREIRLMAAKLRSAMTDILISVNEPTGDVTYYVDAVNGDDSNDGTSPETAWKTLTKASSIRKLTEGGSILLKAGSVWNGEQLKVKNAEGTEENPIVIGRYGDGADPVINGNGAGWSTSSSSKEELAAVHIYNSENIIIENLEITNWDASVGEVGSSKQSSKLLSGLVVENKDAGELKNVVIRNNKIHDVNGKMAGGSEKAAGGLIAVVTGGGSNHTGTVKSYFAGLTIEGNEVYDVCHEAIYMESVWASRTLVGGSSSDTSYQNAGNSQWVGSSDVVIENNYVHDVAGDGIVPINTTDCLVQYNLIDNSADTNWNYSNNPNHAALWTWDTDNVTFRYNEACNTSKEGWNLGISGTNDSMAFDFDYGVQNCLYEYNYSHDNYGGFLMLCPGPGATVNNIARYNISVNDGLYNGAPMIRVGTGKYGSIGVQIYNNTMYWEGNGGYALALAPHSAWEGTTIENVSIFNNIFYGPATNGSISTQSGVSYSNNLVYSSDGSAQEVYEEAANDENAVYADPLFADTTDYTKGSWTDGKTTLGTADGFKITAGSPAIDAGADHPAAPNYSTSSIKSELAANTTEAPECDYYGITLTDGKNDIGASEYAAEPVKVDKSELENAIKDAQEVDAEKYTAESYAKLNEALTAGEIVLADENAVQADVDNAAAAITEAIEGLIEKTEEIVDPKKELKELYNEAVLIEQGTYTDESYQALQGALGAAKAVLDKEDASEKEISDAYDALAEAMNGLTVKSAPSETDSAARAALQKLYDANKNLKQGKYTNSSYAAFTKALKAAAAVLADEDATDKELTAAYENLSAAINGLTVEKSSASASKTVKTGDTAPIVMYVILVILALAVISGVFVVRRRRRG